MGVEAHSSSISKSGSALFITEFINRISEPLNATKQSLMKKYLKLLFVALFATMTFAFTACGDDDDEPDGGSNNKGVVGELTIDGSLEKFYYIQGGKNDLGYNATAWNKDARNIMFDIYSGDITDYSEGSDLSDVLGVTNSLSSNVIFDGGVISGKVTLDKIDSKYATISFDNAVFKGVISSTTFTINGKIKLPIEGELGSSISIMM